jgi:hypothetical protein
MHEHEPPKSKNGSNFYSHVLEIQNGQADLVSLRPTMQAATPVDPIARQPVVRPMIAAE